MALEGLNFIREKVRIRDNRTCQQCGKKWVEGQRRLDVHHLDPNEEGKRDYRLHDFNKLITLCHKCHLNLPHNRNKMSNGKRSLTSSLLLEIPKILDYRMKKYTYHHIGNIYGVSENMIRYVVSKHLKSLQNKKGDNF